ncbi:cation:proton antiporter [Aeromicrobium sp. UC242_57]|uniref:cation:proton antiporter domain-containing protein n=1 Tax=Aeromicrobium sp. UC242_57 TaxID=3374624 RepID=UPI00379DD8D3
MSATIAVFAAVVIVFVAVSARASRVNVSPPMVFVLAGFALSSTGLDDLDASAIRAVAEATLALLLFHGAAELRPKDLRTDPSLTARLLLVALPVTVISTFVLVRLLFPTLDVWLVLVLAAALRPQTRHSARRPWRIRRSPPGSADS